MEQVSKPLCKRCGRAGAMANKGHKCPHGLVCTSSDHFVSTCLECGLYHASAELVLVPLHDDAELAKALGRIQFFVNAIRQSREDAAR